MEYNGMNGLKIVFIILISNFLILNVFAAKKSKDYQMIYKIFSNWTYSFNHKDLLGSCNLFSKELIANYQGAPAKDYMSVCNGFKKIFTEELEYRYRFKLHHVYRSNKLAVARITWYLKISKQGHLISTVQDEGLDVFKQNNHGDWQIINYLAYPKKDN